MKARHIIPLTLLLAGCHTGNTLTRTLTPAQAQELAQSLANDKAQALYSCRPFRNGPAPELVEGRWFWHDQRGYAQYDLEAIVTFVANGANPDVSLTPMYSMPLLHER